MNLRRILALSALALSSTPAAADVCNWDGYRDWSRNWNVRCTKDITANDVGSILACIVLDFGTAGTCTLNWLKDKAKEILEVAGGISTDIAKDVSD